MHIDVDTDNMSADMLNVNGNVEGFRALIVHASSDADIRGGKGEILFCKVEENDTTGNEGFVCGFRAVYKSPYLFDVNYTHGLRTAIQWGLTAMNDQSNGKAEGHRIFLTFRRRRFRTAGYSGQTGAIGWIIAK